MGYLDLAGLQYLWDKLKEKFASKSHSHDDRYYTEAEMDGKLNSKVNNNEAGANELFSKLTTSWDATPTDDTYFIRQDINGANHFGRVKFSTIWAYIRGKTDGIYQPKGSYAASEHTHDDRYYTEAEVDGKLSGKSNTGHTHDDRYYTESEVNTKLNEKLSVSGGAMSGNITFSNIGNTNTSNKISWSGSADGADIYYQTTASDQGNLVLNLRDDSNCYLRIAKNGSFKSYFSPDDGNFHGNVNGTADNATTSNGVKDYNDANRTIKIGYAGAGLTAGNLSHVAGYTDNGTKIKDVSKDVLKSQIGLGSYAVAGHTHSSINSLGAKNAQTGRNQAYGNVYSYNSNNSAHEGMPTTYASTIGFGQGSAGTVEICGQWTGGKGLWSRALRDYQDNWYNWQRIYTENYHPNADTAKSVAQTGITGKPELYTKAEVNTLMKKAMYSEGKLVGTGKVTYSYNSDGTLVVPSTNDYIKIVNAVNDYTNDKYYTVPQNTKMVRGTTIRTRDGYNDGKITFDTNGKITCVGYCVSPKSGTCTYYIEAYQYY